MCSLVDLMVLADMAARYSTYTMKETSKKQKKEGERKKKGEKVLIWMKAAEKERENNKENRETQITKSCKPERENQALHEKRKAKISPLKWRHLRAPKPYIFNNISSSFFSISKTHALGNAVSVESVYTTKYMPYWLPTKLPMLLSLASLHFVLVPKNQPTWTGANLKDNYTTRVV